ncbi:MAG: hypothetical protein LW822_00100 [Phycisphaeraceae bacterium]|nr:hypothetical protein [Phycisphaeraceae bacterium]
METFALSASGTPTLRVGIDVPLGSEGVPVPGPTRSVGVPDARSVGDTTLKPNI